MDNKDIQKNQVITVNETWIRRKRESSTDSNFSKEVSPEVILYPAKKKKYGKRWRRNHTTTCSDSSSSDGNDSDDLQHTRFKIVTED